MSDTTPQPLGFVPSDSIRPQSTPTERVSTWQALVAAGGAAAALALSSCSYDTMTAEEQRAATIAAAIDSAKKEIAQLPDATPVGDEVPVTSLASERDRILGRISHAISADGQSDLPQPTEKTFESKLAKVTAVADAVTIETLAADAENYVQKLKLDAVTELDTELDLAVDSSDEVIEALDAYREVADGLPDQARTAANAAIDTDLLAAVQSASTLNPATQAAIAGIQDPAKAATAMDVASGKDNGAGYVLSGYIDTDFINVSMAKKGLNSLVDGSETSASIFNYGREQYLKSREADNNIPKGPGLRGLAAGWLSQPGDIAEPMMKQLPDGSIKDAGLLALGYKQAADALDKAVTFAAQETIDPTSVKPTLDTLEKQIDIINDPTLKAKADNDLDQIEAGLSVRLQVSKKEPQNLSTVAEVITTIEDPDVAQLALKARQGDTNALSALSKPLDTAWAEKGAADIYDQLTSGSEESAERLRERRRDYVNANPFV